MGKFAEKKATCRTEHFPFAIKYDQHTTQLRCFRHFRFFFKIFSECDQLLLHLPLKSRLKTFAPLNFVQTVPEPRFAIVVQKTTDDKKIT